MRALFGDELKKLHGRFVEMGLNISEQIYNSTQAFIEHDKKLAQEVIDTDNNTNGEEMDLEKQALKLIALQQPVATDFRVIISILKASSDLERVGDHAVSIARETIRMKGQARIPGVEKEIAQMTDQVRDMLEKALDAYSKNDELAARNLSKEDVDVDKQYLLIRDEITKAVHNDTETVQSSASYFMVIRLLERIGDHIANLAEWIVYSASGKIVELNPGKANPELVRRLYSGVMGARQLEK
ncbi:phosphate signaling complex protein PhoU [Lentilactobacillus hilgardii]|uniref:phosphate signaling complex protein PhoU n=1 Tax=Lentilactobacillus hilgardii TaxID=1588 RepID=UPI0021A4A3F8|nr:phosphate signaling complex protein PhoU [Lentilactobacillus hilgardii]MCT3398432.1 phosphate signaling complex protein PhoU [Lentilactobacillus hilgardii]